MPIADDFHHLWIPPFVLRGKPMGERADRHPRIFHHCADEIVERRRHKQWFVSLHVDVEPGGIFFGHFRHAVSPGAMRLFRHRHIGPEFCGDVRDAIIIRCDDYLLRKPAAAGRFPHPLDHRPALDAGQAFPGEAGGTIARGNDDE